MSSVLFVQNTKIENSGYLGELVKNDGFEITIVNAKTENIPEKPFDMVVILGASESANDNIPHLYAEQNLVRKCVKNNIPLLGICLGSQLIAKSLGAKVYRGHVKEIGFYNDLQLTNSNQNLTLFSRITNPFMVFQWHADTFDLPVNAIRLASSKSYPNQAFQYKSAIGLQFHLEVNKDMVNLWLDAMEEKLETIPHVDIQKIRLELDKNIITIKSNMDKFYNNFKTIFNLV